MERLEFILNRCLAKIKKERKMVKQFNPTTLAVATLENLSKVSDYDSKVDILENTILEAVAIFSNTQLAPCNGGISGVLNQINEQTHRDDKKNENKAKFKLLDNTPSK